MTKSGNIHRSHHSACRSPQCTWMAPTTAFQAATYCFPISGIRALAQVRSCSTR